MNMTTSTIQLILAAGLVAATTSSALAQAEGADCPQAAAALEAQPHSTDAIWRVASCPVTGPDALADVWARHGAADGTARMNLVEATSTLRDRRLLDAMTRTAGSANRPVTDRLAALLVLMRYYDPRFAPDMENLAGGADGASIPMRIHEQRATNAVSPMPETVRQQISELFARLAAADGDTAVRAGALRLRQVLARWDPSNTPLPPGSISLVAGCGSNVTLRSTADVEVYVQLAVLDTEFEKAYGILAGSAGKPRSLTLSVPAGTVVAIYGGREVARLAERNATCPPGMVRLSNP